MSFNLSKEQFLEHKKLGKTLLFKKISSDIITPVLAYLKISQKFENYNFLFESSEKATSKGRFSVIGLNPDLVWKTSEKTSFINKNFQQNSKDFTEQKGCPLQNLRELISDSKIPWENLKYNNQDLPAICSGIFGYMNYDMVKLMEEIPNRNLIDEINIPDSIFIRPQIIIIFDNLFDNCLICAPDFNNESYETLENKINEISDILTKDLAINKIESSKIDFDFQSNYSESEYCQIVEKAKEYIVNGDIFQVLPSQRFSANYPENLPSFTFYRALRSVNPSPFLFFLKLEDFALSGSSPEIMVSSKDKKITIRPLAGTRKRGANEIEDKEIAQELLNDEKELAEHLMLIDLGRHDVGKVCKENSVKLTEKMTIEFYSHVMHISSNVEGILRDDLEALDALISGFPAGTVSGAPKIRAIEIIEELEKVKSKILNKEIKGIVLDLRGNPGGLLDQAIRVSEVFLNKGKVIVSIKGRNIKEKIYQDEEDEKLTANLPVAVLINEGSASASEIVAGALQDNDRAIIMGSKSFGKGSVQTIIPLSDNKGAVRLTTSLYYTPSGKSIQAHGIEPNIELIDAKIEKQTNLNDSESNLRGHIEMQIQDFSGSENSIGDVNLAIYDKDYQLARAIDLVRGVSVYKSSVSK